MSGALSGKSLGGGAYRLGRLLGQGAMGSVYEATQEAIGRAVAIKVLHAAMTGTLREDQLTRFQREARTAASLGHPNIVQITDFQWLPGEPPFLVMERLAGVSLGEVITREGRIAPTRAAFVASQALAALHAAHEAGIVHRDVKPDNLFLTPMPMVGDVVKVLDFGIAKLVDEAPLTRVGAMVGSPAYMPPEQAFGRPVDRRADVYAVGATLYHALSGALPVDARDVGEFMARVEAPVVPLEVRVPGLDPGLAAVVARAMAKRPEERFATADDMRRALAPWARPSAPVTGALPAVPPTQPGFAQGSQPGFAQGSQPGFAQGSQAGFAQGSQPGFVQGSQAGFVQGSQAGFAQGSLAGFAQGSQPGFVQGSQAGFAQGSQAGFAQGFSGVAPTPSAARRPRSVVPIAIALVVGLGLVAAVVGLVALRHAPGTTPTTLASATPSISVSASAPAASAPPEAPGPSATTASSATASGGLRPKGAPSLGGVDASVPPPAPDAGSRIREASATCAVVQKGMPVFGADHGVAIVNSRVRACKVDAANCLLIDPSNSRRDYAVAIQPGTKKAVASALSQRSCGAFDYCVTSAVSMSPFVTVTADHFTLGCTITPIP